MLVEADAVEAELVHELPGFDVLLIGLVCDLGIEMPAGERIGQVGEFGEFMAVRDEIEQEDFHRGGFFFG